MGWQHELIQTKTCNHQVIHPASRHDFAAKLFVIRTPYDCNICNSNCHYQPVCPHTWHCLVRASPGDSCRRRLSQPLHESKGTKGIPQGKLKFPGGDVTREAAKETTQRVAISAPEAATAPCVGSGEGTADLAERSPYMLLGLDVSVFPGNLKR